MNRDLSHAQLQQIQVQHAFASGFATGWYRGAWIGFIFGAVIATCTWYLAK